MKELKIYSHTPLMYWWPVAVSALGLGIWTAFFGVEASLGDRNATFLIASVPGFVFTTLLTITVFVSTVRMRGIKSAALFITLIVMTVILSLLGWVDDIANAVPASATWISAGAYLWFGGVLSILWITQIAFFDKLSYYKITPGQITKVKVIGGAERTYDARGLAIDHAADDFLRHIIFGLGSGDITLRTAGADPQTMEIMNVFNVRGKIKRLQELSSVEPDSLSEN